MRTVILFIFLVFISCKKDSTEPENTKLRFGQEQNVNILGYNDHAMEPFLSRDGKLLFFNNLNHPAVNTEIFFATRINDSTFQYQGKVKGVNSDYLDAVATLDKSNTMYFVSTRSYQQSYSSLYSGKLSNDTIINLSLVESVSKKEPGWINFDVEVSADGNVLCFTDGRFDENGGPHEANLIWATKSNQSFERTDNSILKNINTQDLEYAACLSENMLELYFTRVKKPISKNSMPQIYASIRKNTEETFPEAYKLTEINGFVEAPTISTDGKILYFHKKWDGMYGLYLTRKQ